MNEADVFLGVMAVVLFGFVGSAAVVGSPEMVDKLHRRGRDRLNKKINDLQTEIETQQFTGGFRSAPKDVTPLKSEIDALEQEKEINDDFWYPPGEV